MTIASLRNSLAAAIALAALAASFMVAAPAQAVRSGDVCTVYTDTQAQCACDTSGSGVTCFGGQLFRASDAACLNDPRVAPFNATQQFNCRTVAFQCNTTLYPCGGCTAATSTAGNTCSAPTGGVYTDQCGSCSCGAGKTLCSTSNTCVTTLTCPAGTTFDPCTNSCSTPYILSAPSGAQTANPNITGNLTMGGNLTSSGTVTGANLSTGGALTVTGNMTSSGDLYMNSGRAIRVDGAGSTGLYIGNWGAGAMGVNTYARGPVYGANGVGGMAFVVGDDATIYDNNWANGMQVRGAFDASVAGVQLGLSGGYLWGATNNIGINTQTPAARLSIGNNVGSVFLDQFSEYQLLLWTGATAGDSYGLGITPNTMVFNTGANFSFDRDGVATSMYINGSGSVGIGTGTGALTAGMPLTLYSTAASDANKSTLLLDGTTTGGGSFAGVRMKHNVFTTGWGADLQAQDAGSFGTNMIFRVTPTGSANTTTPTERMRLANNGNLGVGSRSSSVGYPLDVASTTGSAIGRLSDDSATGNLWTGLRLDRGFGTERYFIGMPASTNEFLIRKDGTTNVMRIATDGTVTFNNNFVISSTGVPNFAPGALYCSGSQYVGMTAAAADGDTYGSYAAANAACNAVVAGSHVCSPDEVLRSVSCGATLPASGTNLRVANGAPGFTNPASDDCGGFATAATDRYGAYWAFNGAAGGAGRVSSCDQSYRLLCCK